MFKIGIYEGVRSGAMINVNRLELSSEFSPAKITDLCTPASDNKTADNKEKPPKDGKDTRVSMQLT